MKNLKEIHTFVICAYKESPFLEKCILSLKKQIVESSIIIITSTPNAYISKMADKYDIPLYINKVFKIGILDIENAKLLMLL